jgi:DNA-binding MarR family transcriptional regulator
VNRGDLQFFKSSPLFKRLLILTALEQNPAISQHTLAHEVGLTSSMINNYIRDLSKEALIKIKGRTNRTMSYNLTAKGFKEKISLLVSYNLETTALYMDAKQEFAQRLQEIYDEGIHRAVLFGAGETAEILYNASKSLALKIIGIVDNDPDKQGRSFANLIVEPPHRIERISPDGVIIASIGRQDEIYTHINSLEARGIPVRKMGSFMNGRNSK